MDLYSNGSGAISSTWQFDNEYAIIFRADGIRKASTGLHATINLDLEGEGKTVSLDYDTFNVQRREDRQRLSNASHKTMNAIAVSGTSTLADRCDKDKLKHHLDIFCKGLEDEWRKQYMPVESEGQPNTPMEFWLRPFIPKHSGVIIFAPPGRGKSYLGLIMGQCINSIVPLLWPVEYGRVLFINLERSRVSLERRLGQINRALHINEDSPMYMQHARGRTLEDVLPAAKDFVKGEGIDLVIVDSMSRTGAGDLVKDVTGNLIIDMLNSLCESWLILAHTPRKDESHLFGSIMPTAGADVEIQLLSQEKASTLGIGLKGQKVNDMPTPPMHILALEFDANGLTDVRKAQLHEFTEIEGHRKMTLTGEVTAYLLDIGQAGASQIADSLGKDRSQVAHVLRNESQFVRLGKQGAVILYGARAQ